MNVIHYFQRFACFLTSCALAVGLVASASAQTVLIDFGSNVDQFRGLPVSNPDSLGHYWNSVQPGLFVENMIDINNGATTIDLGWDTPVGTDSFNGPAGPTDASTLTTDVQFTDIDAVALGNLGGSLEAAFDFAAGPSLADNRVRLQIQGLDPEKSYDLTFFGSHSFSFDTVTEYSVYTDNTYSTLVATTSLAVQDSEMPWLHNRDKVATLSNLSPQTDDILYLQFVGATGMEGYLNSLQIETSSAPAFVGDYNNNGTVDAADYTVWRDNLGSTNELPNDPVGGTIGTDQFDNWKASFGMGAGNALGGTSAIPEPASLRLLCLAAIGMLSFRRPR